MLQTLFESAHDAIVVIDDRGRFVDANPAACELFGITRATANRHTLDHFLGDPEFVAGITRGDLERGDLVVNAADGREVAIEYRAKSNFIPGRHLAILRDITERQRVESELRANAEFLRRLIESSHDCIKVLDLEGRLVSMNEGGRRLLEIDEGDIAIGRPWLDLWRDRDLARASAALETARGGGVARFEGQGPTFRGSLRWWETVIAPILDAHGRPERLIAVSRVVTHRVEQQRERELHHERMRQVADAANRAKDEFLAQLAHELRNPLAAIVNGVAVLDAIGAQTERAQATRAVIRRQTQQLAGLLDDLLDTARISERKVELKLESVDFGAVVQAALDGEAPRFEAKKQLVEWTPPPRTLYVRADAIRLRQIVANLVNNAQKYTGPGGRIAVAVEQSGGEAILRVSDNGRGIPPERLEDVFELFTQLGPPQGRGEGGLGIGLALVRRLAELHGGRVEAASPGLDRGATFTVWLPQGDPPVVARSSERSSVT